MTLTNYQNRPSESENAELILCWKYCFVHGQDYSFRYPREHPGNSDDTGIHRMLSIGCVKIYHLLAVGWIREQNNSGNKNKPCPYIYGSLGQYCLSRYFGCEKYLFIAPVPTFCS